MRRLILRTLANTAFIPSCLSGRVPVAEVRQEPLRRLPSALLRWVSTDPAFQGRAPVEDIPRPAVTAPVALSVGIRAVGSAAMGRQHAGGPHNPTTGCPDSGSWKVP